MDEPRGNTLSIIIPIYNTDKYLKRCLDSVMNIQWPVKIILIDDGSTDSSGIICDEYASNDSRFTVIHQKNTGLVNARKIGVENVDTHFFSFIDSDDCINVSEYNEMLELILGMPSGADVFCFGMEEEFRGTVSKRVNHFPDGMYSGERLNELFRKMLSYGDFFDFGILPNAVAKVYRTEFVRKSDYNISDEVTIGEDADMTYQLLLQANSVYIINKTPYCYCRREDSLMWKRVDNISIESLENDLRNAFVSYKSIDDCLLKQLDEYMNFIYLLCNPTYVLGDKNFFKNNSDKIALYGAGGVGKSVRYGMNSNFTLWVDRNYKMYQNDCVESVESLLSKIDIYDKIYIAIANVNICKHIRDELALSGINKYIYFFGMDE